MRSTYKERNLLQLKFFDPVENNSKNKHGGVPRSGSIPIYKASFHLFSFFQRLHDGDVKSSRSWNDAIKLMDILKKLDRPRHVHSVPGYIHRAGHDVNSSCHRNADSLETSQSWERAYKSE